MHDGAGEPGRVLWQWGGDGFARARFVFRGWNPYVSKLCGAQYEFRWNARAPRDGWTSRDAWRILRSDVSCAEAEWSRLETERAVSPT
jgi:hypothetical protein